MFTWARVERRPPASGTPARPDAHGSPAMAVAAAGVDGRERPMSTARSARPCRDQPGVGRSAARVPGQRLGGLWRGCCDREFC